VEEDGREGLVMPGCACRILDIFGLGTCYIAILDLQSPFLLCFFAPPISQPGTTFLGYCRVINGELYPE